jgi:general secretion pathway protein G
MYNPLRKRLHESKNEGFTLIELLIVIVILGILAAIVVFAVGGITDKGQTAACKADRKSIQTAEEAYFAQPAGGNGSYAAMSVATPGPMVPKYLAEASTLYGVTVVNGAYIIAPIAGAGC